LAGYRKKRMRKTIIIEHERGVRKIKSSKKTFYYNHERKEWSLLHKLFISTTIIIVSSYSLKIWRFLEGLSFVHTGSFLIHNLMQKGIKI
jgi:hypothetical protein